MNTLRFTVTHPWGRPEYTTRDGEKADTMLLTDTIDFRSKVSNAFVLAARLTDLTKRLPSSDEMAIHVDIKSTHRCKALFVVKNILDSLKCVVFNDDSQIQSIAVKQHYAVNDLITVSLYINKNIYCERDVLELQPLIQFDVSTQPVDYIIPTRKSFNHVISQNKDNEDSIALISNELHAQCGCINLLNSVSQIAINVATAQSKADLDNIGIIYLLSLDKLLYTDIACIDSVVLNLDRRSTQELVEVRVDEPGDTPCC
jgi:hypothetical protein